eukprot:gnl/TRDRNA2_/TRDRNA2_163237_c0_seq3.p3 gnl/TRDRNA2_/TRDRNA2_163237_c0~~gnl/TRDRNA2_/TRDRNA2_163237_c0_seq3.p3  ORF type:complete len:113 (+),score=10.24 gnl/TRDRNA2_/TRDRNA2_163237_c0_seq3:81-419(+)
MSSQSSAFRPSASFRRASKKSKTCLARWAGVLAQDWCECPVYVQSTVGCEQPEATSQVPVPPRLSDLVLSWRHPLPCRHAAKMSGALTQVAGPFPEMPQQHATASGSRQHPS